METIQFWLFVLVAILVASTVWEPVVKSIKHIRWGSLLSVFNKKEEKNPVIQDRIDELKKKVEDKEVDKLDKDSFAEIVAQWEIFVSILESNGMRECAEDMKTLLVKMAKEYRKDLNDDDAFNALDSIVVKEDSIDSLSH